jgi:hypothetical protein
MFAIDPLGLLCEAQTLSIDERLNMKTISLGVIALAFQGCASLAPVDVIRPSEISVDAALKSIGTGLKEMQIAQDGLKTGLFVSEATATIVLGVSASDASKLTLDFSKSSIEAGASKEGKSEGKRENTITVKFVNLLSAPESSLIQKKTPAEIAAIIKALDGAGIKIFQVQQ